MDDEVLRLSGSRDASAAIEAAKWQQPVRVEAEPDPGGGLRFIDQAGRLLGTITARHRVASRVSSGDIILHCSVSSTRTPSAERPTGSVKVRIVTGGADEAFEAEEAPTYTAIVKSAGSAALSRCHIGQPVILWHEVGNPDDPEAIVAKTPSGETIGYLPRDSWLRVIIHEEGCGAQAHIRAPARCDDIELRVTLDQQPLEQTLYGDRAGSALSMLPKKLSRLSLRELASRTWRRLKSL